MANRFFLVYKVWTIPYRELENETGDTRDA